MSRECDERHIYYEFFLFFFFKQKTAYEMRISDWSSDVCSSDLACCAFWPGEPLFRRVDERFGSRVGKCSASHRAQICAASITASLHDAVSLLCSVAPPTGPCRHARMRFGSFAAVRSEERLVGKEGVGTCRFRGSRYH